MKECFKCGTDCKIPGIHVQNCGEVWYLCHFCQKMFHECNKTISEFLEDDKCSLISNKIMKDVIMARMKRMGIPKVDN